MTLVPIIYLFVSEQLYSAIHEAPQELEHYKGNITLCGVHAQLTFKSIEVQTKYTKLLYQPLAIKCIFCYKGGDFAHQAKYAKSLGNDSSFQKAK